MTVQDSEDCPQNRLLKTEQEFKQLTSASYQRVSNLGRWLGINDTKIVFKLLFIILSRPRESILVKCFGMGMKQYTKV